MTTLSAAARETIRAELATAGHGAKAAVVERLAAAYGVSKATVYRLAAIGGTRRKRAPKHPEYRDWTRIAVATAHRVRPPVPLDVAVRACINGGLLPPEAAGMPIATARRIARDELGLKVRAKRTHRLHADYPMQALQIDGSTSEYFTVEGPEGGDWRLKLHRRPYSAGGYKNKPLKAHRMRLLVYAAWDMNTGMTLARYAVERGESGLGAMEFLCWALGEDKDPRLLLHGVPADLWSDQGPLVKHAAMRDLLERLDITPCLGAPYAKERMGGVERSHRTRWSRFERSFFLRRSETLLLSELNARLTEFTIEENARRPARTLVGDRVVSRAEAWTALVPRREPPLRKLPANPIETLAREARRYIDRNGIIRWRGEYEVEGDWCDRWVIARRALDGSGDLAIEDEATGAKRSARRYTPSGYGEVRTAPATPLEKLVAEDAPGPDADVWAPADATNLAVLPVRGVSPAAPLGNPLDTDALPDIESAMRIFHTLYPWPLNPATRALVIQRIQADGLSRRAVTELAQSLTTLAGTG